MNFYKRHLGDYAKDAGHLSMLEHGAYTLLLDRYYTTERPIPHGDAYRVGRARSVPERAAVDAVIAEFFMLDGDSLHNRRADEEIAKASHQREVNQEIGKRGGRPKRTESITESVSKPEPNREPNRNPSQTPDTRQEKRQAPSVLPESTLRADPAPPPSPFDGLNAQALNGKAVVTLAATWELPEEWGNDAVALGFQPREVLHEAERYRQFWTAGRGANKRKSVKGWRQAWSNWLGKAAENRR